jgi:hypothetical protein
MNIRKIQMIDQTTKGSLDKNRKMALLKESIDQTTKGSLDKNRKMPLLKESNINRKKKLEGKLLL